MAQGEQRPPATSPRHRATVGGPADSADQQGRRPHSKPLVVVVVGAAVVAVAARVVVVAGRAVVVVAPARVVVVAPARVVVVAPGVVLDVDVGVPTAGDADASPAAP